MLQRLLVPLDGTPFAEGALPYAEALASRTGAVIHLVRSSLVRHPPLDGTGEQRIVAEERAYLAGIAKKLGGKASVTLQHADPADAIVGQARQWGADLIIMATHERGPFGRNAEPTAAIRTRIRASGFTTPVVCTGGVHNFEFAEKLLADGSCDIVGAARQSLADPDWFRKVALGLGASVRTCEFTNYCEGLDQKHKAVTCQLWDKEAIEEPGIMRTPDGKRRLVAPDWTPPA